MICQGKILLLIWPLCSCRLDKLASVHPWGAFSAYELDLFFAAIICLKSFTKAKRSSFFGHFVIDAQDK
jgi:hypothetical protein